LGQHDRRDVARNVAEGGEVRLEPFRKAGNPRVDRRQPAGVLDQIPVDLPRAEAVNAGNDVGRGTVDARILFARSASHG